MNQWKKTKGLFSMGLALSMALYTNVQVFADVTTPPLGNAVAEQPNQAYPGSNQQENPFYEENSSSWQPSGENQANNNQALGGNSQTNSGPASQAGTGTGNITGTNSPSKLPVVTATVTTSAASGQNTSSTVNIGTEKPVIKSQGAVLYDATNNRFLFEQNADTRYFPASITKLMTALLVLENTSLDSVVTFSNDAVTNLELGAVSLNVKAGDQISVKDCLYGLLLKSANEVANGLAEHVSGSVSSFADLMNQRAASLGCTNTNFVNPNGLNNPNHVTTARDMALIAKAAFENPVLRQIESTMQYSFPATASVPTVRNLTMSHKMLNPANTSYYYPGVIGGKTGYTSLAGNTLVTCAEQDGVRLIAVVLKSKQTHYEDTKALFDYGFSYVKSQAAQNAQNPSSPSSGPSGSPGGQSRPVVQNGNTWFQDSVGWKFVKADGGYAKNECLNINNEIYCFKDDQYMVNGWYQIDGIWRFFRSSGGLAKTRWIETNGKWYYVDENGALLTNGITPDGYKVDENGVWVE